jgi:hypothetical protein
MTGGAPEEDLLVGLHPAAQEDHDKKYDPNPPNGFKE